MHWKLTKKQCFLSLIAIVFLSRSTSSSSWRTRNNRFCEILAARIDYNDDDKSNEPNTFDTVKKIDYGKKEKVTTKIDYGNKEKVTTKEKTPPSGAPSSSAGGASIQYMITNRMRRVLEDDLSYLSTEVDVMDPQIASVVISRGLSRPSSGMPKKWAKHQPKAPSIAKYTVRLKSSFDKLADFAVHKFLPVALPLVAVLYLLPRIIPLVLRNGADGTKFSNDLIPARYNLKSRLNPGKKDSNSRSSSPPRKNANSPTNRNNINMRSLNQIVQPSSFLGNLFRR